MKKEKEIKNRITPRIEDYSQWYLDVIESAELVSNSPVRGCMVIRPNGYAIWENIQRVLNGMFKETGVRNAYFPLFIPVSFLEKEAEHVEGFAKEVAVVTHHRLAANEKGKLIPQGPLEEPLIIRPTSETIMYYTFAQWIHSYRDLPLLINQWANVVRWEMRTRPFLRTTEFLWQEGHTAHSSKEEANLKTREMLDVYQKFAEEYLAIPVIPGVKSESEKFAGAEYTMCVEAMMQDGKALQCGTSHMLGQKFANAFDVSYLDQNGKKQFAWQTSWGLSTRLIGALIMVHSDDTGLVLPPKIAPFPVVTVPIWAGSEEQKLVVGKANELAEKLRKEQNIDVHIDTREDRPGPKFFDWERKGIPIRIEIGPKDVSKKSVVLVRRDTGAKEIVGEDKVFARIPELLDEIQKNLYDRALKFREAHTYEIDNWKEFEKTIETKPGFIYAYWCGSKKCEASIKSKTKATVRCIPFERKKTTGKCVLCSKEANERVMFGVAY